MTSIKMISSIHQKHTKSVCPIVLNRKNKRVTKVISIVSINGIIFYFFPSLFIISQLPRICPYVHNQKIYIYEVQTCQATPGVANSSGSCNAEMSHLKVEGARQQAFTSLGLRGRDSPWSQWRLICSAGVQPGSADGGTTPGKIQPLRRMITWQLHPCTAQLDKPTLRALIPTRLAPPRFSIGPLKLN